MHIILHILFPVEFIFKHDLQRHTTIECIFLKITLKNFRTHTVLKGCPQKGLCQDEGSYSLTSKVSMHPQAPHMAQIYSILPSPPPRCQHRCSELQSPTKQCIWMSSQFRHFFFLHSDVIGWFRTLKTLVLYLQWPYQKHQLTKISRREQ